MGINIARNSSFGRSRSQTKRLEKLIKELRQEKLKQND